MRARITTAGLRAIAMFEAAKGLAVLLVHRRVNSDRRVSHALLHSASRLTDARLWGIAAAAVVYTCVRLTEAWGLWRHRTWAQRFAPLSGAMYLPWEFVELVDQPNWLHVSLFLGNLAILPYMLSIRAQARRAR